MAKFKFSSDSLKIVLYFLGFWVVLLFLFNSGGEPGFEMLFFVIRLPWYFWVVMGLSAMVFVFSPEERWFGIGHFPLLYILCFFISESMLKNIGYESIIESFVRGHYLSNEEFKEPTLIGFWKIIVIFGSLAAWFFWGGMFWYWIQEKEKAPAKVEPSFSEQEIKKQKEEQERKRRAVELRAKMQRFGQALSDSLKEAHALYERYDNIAQIVKTWQELQSNLDKVKARHELTVFPQEVDRFLVAANILEKEITTDVDYVDFESQRGNWQSVDHTFIGIGKQVFAGVEGLKDSIVEVGHVKNAFELEKAEFDKRQQVVGEETKEKTPAEHRYDEVKSVSSENVADLDAKMKLREDIVIWLKDRKSGINTEVEVGKLSREEGDKLIKDAEREAQKKLQALDQF